MHLDWRARKGYELTQQTLIGRLEFKRMKLQLDISELFAALLVADETHATALQLAWWLGLIHHEPMPLPVAHVGICIPLHPLDEIKTLVRTNIEHDETRRGC